MIDPKLHLESIDFKIQEYIQNDVEEYCKKFSNEEAKIIFLNNVPFELAINFEFIKRKELKICCLIGSVVIF
uniref:Flagellar motor switch protein FliM n=1 Tax=Globodera pallida TaxID=36090 RepID=A0A183CA34_GLOPA